jgi:uncharacterized protein
LSGVTVSSERRAVVDVLRAFALFGIVMTRSGLTTYLTQSVFGAPVFLGIGLGLMGKLGVAASVGLGIAFYVVQIFLWHWWLRNFATGPVEWLWRSLTYFKLQPLIRPGLGTA